jgi:hypothetical protein
MATRPSWAVRHPLFVPLALLVLLSFFVAFFKPGVDSWWTIHLTILWGFGTGVVALYLVARAEAWRLLWGARTVSDIESDVHDHIRSLEDRMTRVEKVPCVVAGLAAIPREG